MLTSLKQWFPLLSRFLGGQALIQVINLCTALLLLRLLPVQEYALFVIASFYLSIGSVGSDLNLSTALSTFGTRIAKDRKKLSGLFALIAGLRRKLFFIMLLIIIAASAYMVNSQSWSSDVVMTLLIPVLITVWVQQKLTLRAIVLNVQHDVTGIFKTALAGGFTRLILTIGFCSIWPLAIIAVLSLLVSVLLANYLTKQRCKLYLDEKTDADQSYKKKINNFIYPLLPAAIYFTFQGQISILLVSLVGTSNTIAEVGALSRFTQIFSFLGVLNGFFFQPAFSRIKFKEEFVRKLLLVLSIFIIVFSFTLLSAWLTPDLWLLLLGGNYSGLKDEVLLAVAAPIASYLFGFFFTLLASRAFTQGQYWYVLITLVVQVLFIFLVGVDTTHKALQLNFMNSVVTMLVEIVLLFLLVKDDANWIENE